MSALHHTQQHLAWCDGFGKRVVVYFKMMKIISQRSFPVQATFVPSTPHPQFDVVELTRTCEDKSADRIRTHATNNLVGLLWKCNTLFYWKRPLQWTIHFADRGVRLGRSSLSLRALDSSKQQDKQITLLSMVPGSKHSKRSHWAKTPTWKKSWDVWMFLRKV